MLPCIRLEICSNDDRTYSNKSFATHPQAYRERLKTVVYDNKVKALSREGATTVHAQGSQLLRGHRHKNFERQSLLRQRIVKYVT